MIINDTHRFVFVHIPKCAGTSVRNALQAFDSKERRFTRRVDKHPVLGELDYVHIPLFVLRDHFPEEFESVRNYWSFAVIRDPFSRFASSVSQRLKMYSERPLKNRGRAEIKASIDESIEYLSRQPRDRQLLPANYIHFQKQIDYLDLDGDRIIDNVYLVEDINALLQDVSHRVGHSLIQGSQKTSQREANQTVVYRSELVASILRTTRPLADRVDRVLPRKVKEIIQSQLYVPRDKRLKDLFGSDYVREFVCDYYAGDVALYHAVIRPERSHV